MLDSNVLGERIRVHRVQRGLTQGEFAEIIGVSFQAVSNWERGITPPDVENLMRIAAYFGVLVDELLRPAGDKLSMGIDGGGTKTEFAVITQEGRVVYRGVLGGSNPNDVGLEKSFSVLSEGIRAALVVNPGIGHVFCGIAGMATGDHSVRLADMLRTAFPTITFEIQSDTANLLAMDDEAGMAAISGTGSVVIVRQGKESVSLGGWGYLLDSAGSAYDMGRDAVAAVLQEEDAGESPSILAEELRVALRTGTVRAAIGLLYARGRGFIASLADVVFRAYEAGDGKAIAIVDKNAARLAELMNMAMRRYAVPARAVVGGGMFEHHGAVMRAHIRKYTKCELVQSELPPIYGACKRSLQSKGAISREIFENFYESYRRYCYENCQN